jgi:hypothetical protein
MTAMTLPSDDTDCSNTSQCSSDAYLLESFNDADHDVFVYQDDLFYNTNHAPYANGQWEKADIYFDNVTIR